MTGRGDQPAATVHGIRLPSVAGTDLRSHVITNRTQCPKSKFRLQTSRSGFASEATRAANVVEFYESARKSTAAAIIRPLVTACLLVRVLPHIIGKSLAPDF
ncbi:hypothetical protein AAFG07_08715 [Bradyrhizobium sp. B097]|uniref:hypothetical protein n=1 Tax=Bradyrhizobium sp. B097 TaxID=3140244 RepID=UPI00318395DC